MLTGELRNKVDTLWNTFWTGGISNPLEVIEQITYLLFLKRLERNSARDPTDPNSGCAIVGSRPKRPLPHL